MPRTDVSYYEQFYVLFLKLKAHLR